MTSPPSGAMPPPPAGPPPAGPPPAGPPPGAPPPGFGAPQQTGAVPASAVVPPQSPVGAASPGPVPPQKSGQDSAGQPRTGLSHALLSEWTKIRSVRSTVWTVAVMFAVTFGIALLSNVLFASVDEQVPPPVPGTTGVLLGHIAIVTFGVLVSSTEYTTGMIRMTLTACPARGRIVAAKMLVFAVIAFTTTAAALGLSMVLTNLMQSQYQTAMPSSAVADSIVGTALYITLLGMLAVAMGFLLRSSAGAITLMLGVVLLPTIITPFLYIADSTRDLASVIDDFSAMGSIMSLSMSWDMQNMDYSGWPQMGVLAGIVAVATVGAYLRVRTSDA